MSAARMLTQPTVRARRQKARTARRWRLVTEREKLAALVEAAIARMDQIDGDDDLELNGDEDEDGGDGHPNDLCGRHHLGPGDAADAEEDGDAEFDPAEFSQLDLCDDEPSRNHPVTEGVLGQAIFTPQAIRKAPNAPLPVVLPEPPEGYVAVRVLR